MPISSTTSSRNAYILSLLQSDIDDDMEDYYDMEVILTRPVYNRTSQSALSTTTTTTTTGEFIFNKSGNLTSMDYFQYGINNPKFRVLKGFDDHDDQVVLTKNVFFLNRTYNKFFINVDGFVMFLPGLVRISPFDSDIDTRANGLITHGEIDRPELLNAIAEDVNRVCPSLNFTPTWAYLVTWYKVRPYAFKYGDSQYGSKSQSENTFQLVMASQGSFTAVIFNYVRLDWPNFSFNSHYDTSVIFYFNIDSYGVFFQTKNKTDLLNSSNFNHTGRWIVTFNNTNCLV
jgi:hypothetical protein